MKKAIILNNIGTPSSPSVRDVKAYLDEFLMDPAVIQIPFLLRWILVKILITPKRSPASAKKYESIWFKEGSPLFVYSKSFAEKLQKNLGPDNLVILGMRYGEPSIRSALEQAKKFGAEEIYFCPLYPQNAEATTGSSLKKLEQEIKAARITLPTYSLKPFYRSDFFITPTVELIEKEFDLSSSVLFSFHGLPESQLKKNMNCLKSENCCDLQASCQSGCYRAQCLATAKRIAERLRLEKYSVGFQSRLGPTKWIGPSTTDEIKRLVGEGQKNLTVVCPSFVADCLETIEEMSHEARELFHHLGGENWRLVQCVNDSDLWVEQFTKIIKKPTDESFVRVN